MGGSWGGGGKKTYNVEGLRLAFQSEAMEAAVADSGEEVWEDHAAHVV